MSLLSPALSSLLRREEREYIEPMDSISISSSSLCDEGTGRGLTRGAADLDRRWVEHSKAPPLPGPLLRLRSEERE